MRLNARIRQSEVRVKSGLRLVAVLALATAVAFLSGVTWLGKLAGGVTLFFLVVSCVEYWNAWRLKRRLDQGGDTGEDDDEDG